LWIAAFLALGFLTRGGDVWTVLGLQSLSPFTLKGVVFWKSLILTTLISGLLFLLLAGWRRMVPFARGLPLSDFLLSAWLPSAGALLTVIRIGVAYPGADWLAKFEPFLISLLIPLLLTCAGAILLRPFRPATRLITHSRTPYLMYILITNLIGAVAVAVLLYLIALCGLFYPSVLWGFTALVIVSGLPFLIRDLREVSSIPRQNENLKGASLVLWGALLIVLMASTQLSFLPPDDSDELRYHLSIPKRYLEHHGVVEIEGQQFSHFPLGMEMLFALPLSLDWLRPERFGLVTGVKFVHTWFFALSLMLIVVWSRELSRSRGGGAAAWSAWIFASIPFAPVLASWAFVDFCSAFGWMASAYFFGSGSIPLAAVALGWSLMVKYTGLAWWAILIAVAFWFKQSDRHWKSLLSLLVLPPLFASPWLLHNAWTTGNPFSPLLATHFGGGFDALQRAFYDWHAGMKGGWNEFRRMSYGMKILDLIGLPFRATLFPERFEGNPIGGLLICLLPLALLSTYPRKGGGHRRFALPNQLYLPILSLSVFLLWGLTYRDPRFAIPLWGFLALLIGRGLSCLCSEEMFMASRRWIAHAITAVVLVWGLGQTDEVFLRTWRFSEAIFLKQPLDTYLTRPDRLPIVTAIREVEAMRKEAGGGSGKPPLLLLGQEQSYYFDSPVRGNDYFDGPELAPIAREATSVEEISEKIKALGYKWVWVNRGTLEGNVFNLVRGGLFCLNLTGGVEEMNTLASRNPGELGQDETERLLGDASKNESFRQMHTWLVKHPGFKEVPLTSVREEERPICPLYGDWLKWPEMAGVSALDLPRRNVSLLRAE
jgi:hypothetical protein